jgi:hypothetical protein
MSLGRVDGQRLPCGQPVADSAPVCGGGGARVDAQRLDGVNHREHRLDLQLAIGAQQYARAGCHAGNALSVVK